MNLTALLGGVAWGGYWDLMRKYHRFEVRGLEHILNHRGPALIVGYHGKPGARDLIMLQTQLLREHGMVTHAVTHDMMLRLPFVRSAALGMQLIGRDPASIEAAVKRKEKLVVTPGGIEEAWGSFRDRYTVKWRRRLGYLKLAIEHKLPIIPVGAVGVDDAFYGLYNAYEIWKPLGTATGSRWARASGSASGRSAPGRSRRLSRPESSSTSTRPSIWRRKGSKTPKTRRSCSGSTTIWQRGCSRS